MMPRFVFTRALQERGEREGWSLFESDARGWEVERIDSPDHPDCAVPLANDDDAIALARAAGVPCLEDGTFADHVDLTFEGEDGEPAT
jgi:hypothetical protein